MIAAETQQTTTFRGFVLYSKNSEPALAALANPIETYPMCFQYTTLVPNNVFIEQCNLHQIQTSLVNIWQKHIQNWHNAQDQKSVEPTPAANSSTIPQAAEASSNGTQPEKNGHILQPIPEGTGMFCVTCGIYTTYMKHIRLKILKNPCKFKYLPANKWLTKPGMHEANSRLDQEERSYKTLTKLAMISFGIDSLVVMKPNQRPMVSYFARNVNAHGHGVNAMPTYPEQYVDPLKQALQRQNG